MPTVPSSNLTAINNLGANFPGSPAQSGLVIGPTVSGTANSIIQDDSISTVLANFGGGPGSEYAATALTEPNHGTVYQIKSATSTAGTVGSVTKTTGASVGAASNDYGAVLAPSAVDFNGDVFFVAKQAGAEISITSGMATNVSVVGLNVAVTVTAATTGTQLATLVNGTPAAFALWGGTAQGTGASICCQTLAVYSETAGRIVFEALTSGISYQTTISAGPHPAARSVSLSGGNQVNIVLGTNANGEPNIVNSSAILIQSDLVALAAANPGKFRTSLAGSGAGLLGTKSLTALSFGSTGTMTASGSPNDAYDVSVQITGAGGLGTASFRVSLGTSNGQPIYSGAIYQVPAGGSFVIPDTGITIVFAGTFDVGDTFTFATTAPLSTLADISAALTYFLTRPETVGLIAVAGQIPVASLPAWVAAINVLMNQLEAAKKYCRIMLEYEGPASGQSNAVWAANVASVLAPLSSARISLSGGAVASVSSMPLPQAGRPVTVNGQRAAFARLLALPSGIDVGDQTNSGSLTSVTKSFQYDVATTLANARSSYAYLLPAIPGVQYDSLLFDSPTGDYTYMTYGRVLDEAMFYGYLRQTKYLNTAQLRNANGTIATAAAIAIEKDLRQVLLDNIVTPGNATDVRVVVDRTNTDNRLKITYYVQLLFYVKQIDGRAGVVRSLTATQVL